MPASSEHRSTLAGHPRTRVLAWAVGGVNVALMLLSVGLVASDLSAFQSQLLPVLGIVVGSLASAIVASVIGLMIAIRHRRNPIGWLCLALAFSSALYVAAEGSAVRALVSGLPPTGWVAWLALVGNVANTDALAAGPLIVLLFPAGRWTGRAARPLAYVSVGLTVLLTVVVVFDPGAQQLAPNLPAVHSPIGSPALSRFSNQDGSAWPLTVALLGTALVATVLLLLRLRRATGVEREQLKWFAYGSGLVEAVVAVFVVALVIGSGGQQSGAGGTAALMANFIGHGVLPSLPAVVLGSIGVAILRHRLYDIDIVISRTLVYGALAAFITGVYVAIVVGVGTVIGQGDRPNLALSIVATAVVAVGFQPVRDRLQGLANRLVYGRRATPYEVLAQFGERVADGYGGDEVLGRMARVLADGSGAERAAVWLRVGRELRLVAAHPGGIDDRQPVPIQGQLLPSLADADRTVAVRHRGELLGALTVTKRRGEALTPVEEKLVTDLAHQAGLVLKNVGLTADLRARVDDLRASRQRLVAAQDLERRRLERNLHDGAQQYLVAIKVKLGIAESLTLKDAEKAQEHLAAISTDVDEALETLRDLVRGIYPPLLAGQGLGAALQAQARKATVPVEVDSDGVGRYSQETEAAVYFCVLEALQNVQKYAGATRVTIRLGEGGGSLRFEVEDDGRGFAAGQVARGAGLQNMTDRLDALGGQVEIDSAPGRGARVVGRVPAAAPS